MSAEDEFLNVVNPKDERRFRVVPSEEAEEVEDERTMPPEITFGEVDSPSFPLLDNSPLVVPAPSNGVRLSASMLCNPARCLFT